MSRLMDRLFRAIIVQGPGMPFTMGAIPRLESPTVGSSTLITSAPKSARRLAAKGPANMVPRSSTLSPARGPADFPWSPDPVPDPSHTSELFSLEIA